MTSLIIGYLLNEDDFIRLSLHYLSSYADLYEEFGGFPRLNDNIEWYTSVNEKLNNYQKPYVLVRIGDFGVFGYNLPIDGEFYYSNSMLTQFSPQDVKHYITHGQHLTKELRAYGCNVQGEPQVYVAQSN